MNERGKITASLPGERDRLGCVTQIRVRATCQRDEFSLCTSKFESDMPSHAVGLCSVISGWNRFVSVVERNRFELLPAGFIATAGLRR